MQLDARLAIAIATLLWVPLASARPHVWDMAAAAHGSVLDSRQKPVDLDAALIEAMQKDLTDKLEAALRGKDAKALRRALAEIGGSQDLKDGERLVLRNGVIATFLPLAPESLRAEAGWRADILRERAPYAAGMKLDPPTVKRLTTLITDRALDPSATLPLPPDPTYIDDCRDAGVPIPPDWPSELWQDRGALHPEFISPRLWALAFGYADPAVPGACLALPRADTNVPGAPTRFLGIICQSATTGAACFWDNKTLEDGRIEDPLLTIRLPIARIGNGRTIRDETCTQCHRGDNVFLAHPGSAVDGARSPVLATQPPSGVRYTPLGRAPWINGGPLLPRTVPGGPDTCTSCHEIASPSAGYCGILLQAATRTMPPGRPPAATRDPDFPGRLVPPPVGSSFRADILAIKAACDF